MPTNDPERQLGYRGGRFGARQPSLLTKIIAIAGGVVVLAGAVAISLVVLAVVLTVGLVVAIYLWWKTRDVRKQLRERHRPESREGTIIEGEVIRENRPDETKRD